MTLTEQWKKGELPSGWYYYKSSILGNITIADSSTLHKYRKRLDWKDIITILAKVPSYEEYQQLLSDQLAKQEGEEIIAELEHENLLLKVANAELRSRLDGIVTQLEQAFYDDKVSFWDILVKIKKGLDK